MPTPLTNRTGVAGVIPTPIVDEILRDVYRGNPFLRYGVRKSVVGGKIRVAVVGTKPMAYKVSEGNAITASNATITAVDADAEKFAVIVPISSEALEDTSVDLWAEIVPEAVEAINRKVAMEVATMAATKAINAGTYHLVSRDPDVAADLLETIKLPKERAAVLFADDNMEFELLGLRDQQDRPLVREIASDDGMVRRVYGRALEYVPSDYLGTIEADLDNDSSDEEYNLIAVGFADRAFYYGIAREMEYRILEEATVGDLNLAAMDMKALRLTFRIALLIPRADRVSIAIEDPSAS